MHDDDLCHEAVSVVAALAPDDETRFHDCVRSVDHFLGHPYISAIHVQGHGHVHCLHAILIINCKLDALVAAAVVAAAIENQGRNQLIKKSTKSEPKRSQPLRKNHIIRQVDDHRRIKETQYRNRGKIENGIVA